MTHMPPPDDPRIARAWTAFVRHHASLAPPPALDSRVLAAARARTPSTRASIGRSASRPRRWRVMAAGMAAALAATAVAARWARPVAPVAPDAGAVATAGAPEVIPAPSSPIVAADVPAEPRRPERRPERRLTTPRSRPAAPAVVSVPTGLDDGPLQVIRVRVEASALEAFGVEVAGPALAGLVEVDLVVGADGWPRDVRRIRPVPAIARPE